MFQMFLRASMSVVALSLRWGPDPGSSVGRVTFRERQARRTQLTSFRGAECDWVTVGPFALLVVNADSERVFREGFESRHDGLSPPAGEGQGMALIQSLVGI